MKSTNFLFFIFILSSLIFSGCLREYNNVAINSVDVMSSQQDDGIKLTITPYIQNNLNTDSDVLTIKVKIREPATNLIIGEKDLDIGYIKSKSSSSESLILTIPSSGDYSVEVSLFEKSKFLTQYIVPVKVMPKPVPGQPPDIKLTDMNLVITKIYNDASSVLVDVSPGIYNQGGDSKQLSIEVTARVDQYTAYTKTDERGIIKSEDRVRGKVSFDLPRNREYTFTVSVYENGKKIVSGKVNERIKLNEIKWNIPMTYVLVEEGKPTTTPKEPGFEAVIALISLMVVYSIGRKISIKR